MTEVSQARTSTRWALPFLAALIAALAAILLGTTASASAAGVGQTRVGAFNVVGEVLVGPPEHITAGQRLGEAAPQADFVVATGVAAKSANAAASVGPKAVHGNSASSTATNYLYRLYDSESGAYLKTGISKDPGSRYTKTFMQDKEMEILQTGSRREMLNLERFIVERDPGPLNRERWAGSMAGDVP